MLSWFWSLFCKTKFADQINSNLQWYQIIHNLTRFDWYIVVLLTKKLWCSTFVFDGSVVREWQKPAFSARMRHSMARGWSSLQGYFLVHVSTFWFVVYVHTLSFLFFCSSHSASFRLILRLFHHFQPIQPTNPNSKKKSEKRRKEELLRPD